MWVKHPHAIKKVLKISLKVLAALLLILLSAAVALQSPAVQTWVGRKVLHALQDRMEGEITFDKIHIKPFNTLVVNNLALVDRNPEGTGHPLGAIDTVLKAETVSATFSLKGLFQKEGLHVKKATVEHGYLALAIEPSKDTLHPSETNLLRTLGITPKKKDTKREHVFDIGRVELKDFGFKMKNYIAYKGGHPSGSIDFTDLDISEINLRGKDLVLGGGIMSGTAEELSLREKSGFVCNHLSGSTRVGNGKTLIEHLRIRDVFSDLSLPQLDFLYQDTKSWSNFLEEVRIRGLIRNSRLSMQTLGYFAPGLAGKSMIARLDGRVDGYVRNFTLDNLHVETLESNVSTTLSGRVSGLPAIRSVQVDAAVKNLAFTTQGLNKLLSGFAPGTKLDLSRFAPGEQIQFDGTVKGRLDQLNVHGKALADNGSMTADLHLHNLVGSKRAPAVGGTLRTVNLDLGRLAGISALGPCTLRTALNATFTPGNPSVKLDTLFIDRLNALGYDYSGIAANGTYSDNAFNGKVICSDPNLNFLFQGLFTLSRKTENAIYQFYANVGYADLHALGLDKRDISRLSFQTHANFNAVKGGDVIGNIDVSRLMLEDESGRHRIGDINITSHANDDVNRIRLTSAFAEASYLGSAFVGDFVKDLRRVSSARELPSLDRLKQQEYSGNDYRVSLVLRDTKNILSFFKPGLYVADGTSLDLTVGKDGSLAAKVGSQRIAYLDKYIKGIRLDLDNKDGNLTGKLVSDEINISPVFTRGNQLRLLADDDHIGLGLVYDNETDLENKGELVLTAQLSRDKADSLCVDASILPSNLYLNGEAWKIGQTGIRLAHGRVRVDDLLVSGTGQSIQLGGGFSKTRPDTLTLALDQFNLDMLNHFTKQNMGIQGKVTGSAVLVSPVGSDMRLLADLTADQTSLGGEPLGDVKIASIWDEVEKGFRLRLRNDLEGRSSLNLDGLLVPSRKTLSARIDLDSLNLGYARPVLASIFSDASGSIDGTLTVGGPLDKLDISSQDLRFDNAFLKVAFTNVGYTVNGPLHIDSEGVWFDQVTLSDRYGARGAVRGSIEWNHLKDMTLNALLNVRNMEVLDLGEKDNPTFYGHVFATGDVSITGPFDRILLDVNASTAKDGEFHIPLGSASSKGSSNLLTFKTFEEDIELDPYEEMLATLRPKKRKESDLGIRLRIDVNPRTAAVLEVDKATGNVLSGQGSGLIDLEVHPAQDVFHINGDYNISGGTYHFVALGIAKRDFTIQDGSTVKFNGDIMDSDLNINALYRTKTSLGTLIADSTSISTRRTVECGINITDKIRNPRLGFSINIPDLDPTTQARVESALSTEDRVQKQFVSLLLTNSFIPDEQSGIVNNTSTLYSNVTEIMANQLNSILQKLDIPVDLGLDYQQGAGGNDLFDVAVSTELFNNRVIVNGAIGNRQWHNSTATDEVVGDLDIEIKLDKPGAVRLNLFSHSADMYTSYLDNSQRNGIGIAYQKEFNTFKEFFQNLFGRKADRRRRRERMEGQLVREERPAEERRREGRRPRRQEEEKVKITIEE